MLDVCIDGNCAVETSKSMFGSHIATYESSCSQASWGQGVDTPPPDMLLNQLPGFLPFSFGQNFETFLDQVV